MVVKRENHKGYHQVSKIKILNMARSEAFANVSSKTFIKSVFNSHSVHERVSRLFFIRIWWKLLPCLRCSEKRELGYYQNGRAGDMGAVASGASWRSVGGTRWAEGRVPFGKSFLQSYRQQVRLVLRHCQLDHGIVFPEALWEVVRCFWVVSSFPLLHWSGEHFPAWPSLLLWPFWRAPPKWILGSLLLAIGILSWLSEKTFHQDFV